MSKMLLCVILFQFAASGLWGGACIPDTLANYELLTSCTVAALTVSSFTFSQSGTVQIGAANIMVVPQMGSDFGVAFNAAFSVSGSDNSDYVITYLEDPSGEIRSLDDVLNDPVTSPGRAEVDTVGCLGAAFVGSTCPTSNTVSFNVFDAGATSNKINSVNFPDQSMVGVQDTILLNGNGTGSVQMSGVGTASLLPEPGTGWLCAGAVLAAVGLRRRSSLAATDERR